MTTMCDSCAYDKETCPGPGVHCADGHHCTWQDASCAADVGLNDHPEKCCHCGKNRSHNK